MAEPNIISINNSADGWMKAMSDLPCDAGAVLWSCCVVLVNQLIGRDSTGGTTLRSSVFPDHYH